MERMERERIERERAERERLEKERLEKERLEQEQKDNICYIYCDDIEAINMVTLGYNNKLCL
ncbi:hypothetical protein DICPUDRAFT_157345 [Dictyostelium purpureum]|uniref:Uncharacterized protein n=1 Tax=Dictyostelium purpureum TaxID=5786 RepID=F0ZYW6_DICPU|nr:uncharacterized protein DICPUDRAFT_157345 [Dictyostelium purpureum]EGC30867.1 hypothetical protein DICPUDRAFT_157345 [Dictyostelium purpureum]|eukprot:XP_003292604.1 hypothetical protein DICPUDRAFT_157345 [Dictyostelium purpureum]